MVVVHETGRMKVGKKWCERVCALFSAAQQWECNKLRRIEEASKQRFFFSIFCFPVLRFLNLVSHDAHTTHTTPEEDNFGDAADRMKYSIFNFWIFGVIYGCMGWAGSSKWRFRFS